MEYVYIVQSLANEELYKIGCSKNIEQRLRTLQTMNGGGIKLIYLFEVEDCYMEEANLKNFFKVRNVNGEWFNFTRVCAGIISYKILETIGKMYENNMIEGRENYEFYKKQLNK